MCVYKVPVTLSQPPALCTSSPEEEISQQPESPEPCPALLQLSSPEGAD